MFNVYIILIFKFILNNFLKKYNYYKLTTYCWNLILIYLNLFTFALYYFKIYTGFLLNKRCSKFICLLIQILLIYLSEININACLYFEYLYFSNYSMNIKDLFN